MNTNKNRLPVVCAGLLAFATAASAALRPLPTPGPSEYVDAESSVNVPLPTNEGRHIRLTLAFEPSPTNADVFVYMATSESGDDQYDDSVGWTVTANGTVGLQGESSVSEHADAVGGSTYGVTSGAVLLASGHFSPPSDDILRLRLQCWARNVGDGKKETCVQIVVVPRE